MSLGDYRAAVDFDCRVSTGDIVVNGQVYALGSSHHWPSILTNAANGAGTNEYVEWWRAAANEISFPELGVKEGEAKPNMRGLFEVIIIDPETGELQKVDGIIRLLVIAKDEASAKLKIVSKAGLAKDVDDYDIIVRRLGDVRPKQRPQEVKIVKE